MKTSQMIAMLEKNPGLKFIRECNREIYGLGEQGYLTRVANCCTTANIRIDDSWQLVREPVPVWEAIKAYVEGKRVYYLDTDGAQWYLRSGWNLNIDRFNNGKWFIEEGE